MTLPYGQPGMVIARGKATARELVRALQRDLRRLGYLRAGLDGVFGGETERAVRALQYDLIFNDGHGEDGDAPVALKESNQGRIGSVDGVVNDRLAACIEDLLEDRRVPQLPRSNDPQGENRRALETLRGLEKLQVPAPFLLAILSQESGLLHFRVPAPGDADDFIVLGLDRNDRAHPDRITSRGYGVGQFTLFHHPARPEEVEAVMLDPARNVEQAVQKLKEKFEHFVVGNSPGTRADDRLAEIGPGPLRLCRYSAADPRFLKDCRRCSAEAPRLSIGPATPLFRGSLEYFHSTQYHAETRYDGVPDRAAMGCDWPYAVRRYNGSGINSYHYQMKVLRRLRYDRQLVARLGGHRVGDGG